VTESLPHDPRSARQGKGAEVWVPTGETVTEMPMRPTGRGNKRRPKIDQSLLMRAAGLLDGIEDLNDEDLTLTLEALRCVVFELWISVAEATQFHQSILAIVESFLLSREHLDPGQAIALRGAIKDLNLPLLGEQHVEVIRSQFIDQGLKPLAILSEYNDADE
jgi:hypothetical protein